jgi:hypothetical protein
MLPPTRLEERTSLTRTDLRRRSLDDRIPLGLRVTRAGIERYRLIVYGSRWDAGSRAIESR